MKRRQFIVVAAATIATIVRAKGEHGANPVIGYLSARSAAESADIVAAFKEGLRQSGLVEGRNVRIESRFASGDFERLPALADELVSRGIDVLVAAGGNITVLKAKPVVPRTIPIVFVMGGDPVKLGVVASLNKPGGNVTGVSFLINELGVKEIELLHELVPNSFKIGFLINPENPSFQPDIVGAKQAVERFGGRLVQAEASSEGEIEAAFTRFAEEDVDSLFVHSDPFFADQRDRIVFLAMQHKLPLVSQLREFATVGALASYGTSIVEANRQLADYTAKILNGIRPAELPVLLSTKFHLIINLKTAKALGLTVPAGVLARADEVIE